MKSLCSEVPSNICFDNEPVTFLLLESANALLYGFKFKINIVSKLIFSQCCYTTLKILLCVLTHVLSKNSGKTLLNLFISFEFKLCLLRVCLVNIKTNFYLLSEPHFIDIKIHKKNPSCIMTRLHKHCRQAFLKISSA